MKNRLPKLQHNVYVIELDPAKLCLYVGMTGRTPDERFKQHRECLKSAKYPHRSLGLQTPAKFAQSQLLEGSASGRPPASLRRSLQGNQKTTDKPKPRETVS